MNNTGKSFNKTGKSFNKSFKSDAKDAKTDVLININKSVDSFSAK